MYTHCNHGGGNHYKTQAIERPWNVITFDFALLKAAEEKTNSYLLVFIAACKCEKCIPRGGSLYQDLTQEWKPAVHKACSKKSNA